MNTTSRVCSALAACILMGSGVAAAADNGFDRRDPVRLDFRYDASDLATQEGAVKVYRRLQLAVHRQCTAYGARLIELRRTDRRCVSELTEKAIARIGSVQLAGVHRSIADLEIAARR